MNSVNAHRQLSVSKRFDYYLGSRLYSELCRDEVEVIIPDKIRKCVAYLGLETGKGDRKVCGTCFFVSENHQHLATEYYSTWCVTAAHVIRNIQEVRSNLGDNEGQMFLRTNLKSGGTLDLPLLASDWKFHDNPAFDAAVCSITLEDRDDHLSYPTSEFVTPELIQRYQIGIGSDLFFIGLFDRHVSDVRNVPIARVGNIAAMPSEMPVKTLMGEAQLYLVEARSRGGLSGSPVFAYSTPLRALGELVIPGNTFNLLGVIHGHFDDTDGIDKFNAGIAMVTPIHVVREILDGPQLEEQRKEFEATLEMRHPSGTTID